MNTKKLLENNSGFTLIELMVAMVIGGFVLTGVVQMFFAEVKLHNEQFALSRMQQNMRAGLDYMVRYARMSGYDPGTSAGAGFEGTLASELNFTSDIGTLDDASTTNDDIPNGQIDDHWDEKIIFQYEAAKNRIVRLNAAGSPQAVAENIEALNFRYLDQDGNDTTDPAEIRSVQITIVGRTPEQSGIMPGYTNNTVYRNQNGDVLLPAQNDSVRRLAMTAEVKCRNLGF